MHVPISVYSTNTGCCIATAVDTVALIEVLGYAHLVPHERRRSALQTKIITSMHIPGTLLATKQASAAGFKEKSLLTARSRPLRHDSWNSFHDYMGRPPNHNCQ